MAGVLRLVGTPIGNLGDISPRMVDALSNADVVACEDTRRTGKLLSHVGVRVPRLEVVNEHTERNAVAGLLDRIDAGANVVLVSDAGMPGISDPGHVLVTAAVERGVAIEVIPGPSSVLVALLLSGLATDRFVFEGFLPRKGSGRFERIEVLTAEPRTTVLFEAPHRIARTLADLRDRLGEQRPVVIARELTKLHEEVWRTCLGDAAAVAQLGSPRGEHVLVLGGCPDEAGDAPDPAALLLEYASAGWSRRDAVAAVVARTRVPKRVVYDAALTLLWPLDR